MRWAVTPSLWLIAGLFDVRTPYFSTNQANLYAVLGDVRHRGLDSSDVRIYLTVRKSLTDGAMARLLCCSFCGKSEQTVAKLAAGPGRLFICNECVETCRLIMEGDVSLARGFDPKTWPTERLLSVLAPLNRAVEAHRAHLQDIVDVLRNRDVSWAKIAEPLKVSRQSAWERFG